MNLARLALRLALGRREPVTSGRLTLEGLRRPVTVRRDAYGVPHIDASSEEDAWFALGFCQAQDRSFQLELRLRVVRGTTAEVVGESALPIDRLSRRIGFREASLRQLEALDSDVLAQAQAFARGVNAGQTAGRKRRAHEFVLLRAKPSTWDAADVIGVAKLMSFGLLGNWDVELARLKIFMEDGPEALAALDPAYPESLPVTTPPGALAGPAVDRLAEDVRLLSQLTPVGAASNNWAIAPAKTASGRAILACDPHLDTSLPPHWYLAHVRTPDWSVAGAALVGTPGFPVGHNEAAAWGVTAGMVDTSDLYVEQLSHDGRSVREGDDFVPCEVRTEVINVRGKAPVTEEVLVTCRGPVISPAFGGELGALSLRASWLEPRPVRGLMSSHRECDFESFRRQFADWPLTDLNVAYADMSGTIGWQLVGETPRRNAGWGTMPAPGWSADAGWQDFVPFDEMPHARDPDCGYVATANNKPVADDAGPYLGVDWLDGYRVARIGEALAASDHWDTRACRDLQMDTQSLTWREVRATVLALPRASDETGLALDLLSAWDGRLMAESPQASIFELFLAEMSSRMARAKAPRSWEWALGRGFHPLASLTTFSLGRQSRTLRLLREQPAGWLERPWTDEMADALATVVRNLRQRAGASPSTWGWGRIRTLTLENPVGQGALARILNVGPLSVGGDGNTVSQAGVNPLIPLSNPTAIASLRMVAEVGDWENARFVLPGGQSGNPLSPHYDDQVPLWLRGEGVPIAWSEEAVLRAAVSELRLNPASA